MDELRSYQPSMREALAQRLLGAGRPSQSRKQVVGSIMGTQGMPGTEQMSVADAFPPSAAIFGADEAKRSGVQGDVAGSVLSAMAMVPGAKAPELVVSRLMKNIRPTSDDIYEVLDSNFVHGKLIGDATVPIKSLKGGTANQEKENTRVKTLIQKMSGPEGFIERLITRPNGEVIEGQHRLDALRSMGVKDVPVTQIDDLSDGFDVKAMERAVKDAGVKSSDHVNKIISHSLEVIRDAGSAEAALAEYELPGFNKAFRAALSAAKPPEASAMRQVTQ